MGLVIMGHEIMDEPTALEAQEKPPDPKKKQLPEATPEWRKQVEKQLASVEKKMGEFGRDIFRLSSQLELDRSAVIRENKSAEILFRDLRRDIKFLVKRLVTAEREARIAFERTAKPSEELTGKKAQRI